jgi:hypothetical protein
MALNDHLPSPAAPGTAQFPLSRPYYLKSFLEQQGCGPGHQVRAWDHSIVLFERIFCRAGLARIFADAKTTALPVKFLNETVQSNIDRFLSEKDRWLSCIDRLIDFLILRSGLRFPDSYSGRQKPGGRP